MYQERPFFTYDDPVGAIVIEESQLAMSVPECEEFRRRIRRAGFEAVGGTFGECRRSYYLPPAGPFVDMVSIVPQHVIEAMFDTGYYPHQKREESERDALAEVRTSAYLLSPGRRWAWSSNSR